ncbi:MAG: phage major capsid protein [Chloroflexi bacterium]|nr:phage major capsid protein [Chloroflexota bacterium]
MLYATIAIIALIVIAPALPAIAGAIRAGRQWPALGDITGEFGALSLAEAAKLSNDVVLQGVYESIINTSDISGVLPYFEMQGNALTYNRENAAATVAWRAVGDVWTEDVPTYTQITTQLAIVGGDADVDKYIQTSRSNIQDIRATVIMGKAQALAREWDDKIINGSGAANQPTGIKNLIVSGQTLTNGANGATLTLDILDILIDQVKGGTPDLLLMSRRARRSINKLFRASGASVETRQAFGRFIQTYNGIPIMISDYIPTNETVGTSTDCERIYALTLGEENGGIAAPYTPGPNGEIIQLDDIGTLETKDATRMRVKAYVTLAMFGTLKCAMTTGIRPA